MDDITYRVEVGFHGYIGASEEIEIYAPADATEDELLSIIQDINGEAGMLLEIDEGDIVFLGDGEWGITVGFAGYMGVEETYTVYADSVDDAVDQAYDEAIWDLEIISYEAVEE